MAGTVILSNAIYFKTLGCDFKESAALMFEAAANHPTATKDHILLAAEELPNFGCADKAASFYISLANDPKEDPKWIKQAAEGLKKLNTDAYKDRAAALFRRFETHPTTTAAAIITYATNLVKLDLKFTEELAKLDPKYAERANALRARAE